ncbi:biotin transporter BioY [Cellulomonas fimi]|uniref:Biotin transporter n=1 Tax=Cellulomonas fimi TaxID=1708 RepID=A0A7Y0LZF7_CELFI|nr:biotin transporter BioY [Cellulomonas fimi]NMR20769.1 biotin transporter BioY [Cellulomonas fimi]
MPSVPENAPAAVPAGAPAAGPAVAAPTAAPLALRSSVATDVALVATFAALIAACAQLTIPVAGLAVPITGQTFAVMLAGVVLGARRGALAVLLYLAVGLAGLPVFAEATGGLAVVGKASFGYLVAFPFAAALAGLLAGYARRVRATLVPVVLFGAAMAGSLVFTHPIGITVMGWRGGLEPAEAIRFGALFLPGDVIKNALVAVVAAAIFRAFPDMLRQRR